MQEKLERQGEARAGKGKRNIRRKSRGRKEEGCNGRKEGGENVCDDTVRKVEKELK